MIVNSALPPMRQSASSSGELASSQDAGREQTPRAPMRDFDAMVKNGHLPFSSAGTPAESETSSTLFVVETARQAYTIGTSVSDNAISFEARAILGPVGPAPAVSSEVSSSKSGAKEGIGKQSAPPITAQPPTSHAGTIASAATVHQPTQVAAPRTDAGVVDHGQRGPVPNIQTHAFVSRENVSPLKTGMAESRSAARTGAPANLPPQVAARGANFAALVAALPQEVRVTVRGMMLERGEHDELAREIRAALAGHGLDHRSISIISGQGTL